MVIGKGTLCTTTGPASYTTEKNDLEMGPNSIMAVHSGNNTIPSSTSSLDSDGYTRGSKSEVIRSATISF